jgi:DNA repair protein RadC
MERTNESAVLNMVSEVELIYKSRVKPSQRPLIKCAADYQRILRNYYNENTIELQEQFLVLYLNNAHRALGIYKASAGGITGTVADPRLILVTALRLCACSLVLSHCHPSGNLTPSQADIRLTNKIKQAASFIDVAVIDHVIISSEGYLSFSDQGLL